MATGILVVTKADNCGVCRGLEANGLFKSLDDDLKVENVFTKSLKVMGPSSGAAIFNLDMFFPNFMFMSFETFERARLSLDNWKSVYNDIRFFNRTQPSDGNLSITQEYNDITLRSIQQFCNNSEKSIATSKHSKSRMLSMYYDNKHTDLRMTAMYNDI